VPCSVAAAPEKAHTTPVVVFDLDGTLMDHRPRTLAILQEFADRRRTRDAALADRLDRAQMGELEYLLSDSLERMGAPRHSLVEEMHGFLGHVIAAFDNERGNCNVMLAHYPDAHVVFVDTQRMPGGPELDPGVLVVRDFQTG
jgi:phosphoserine phosphatase